MTLRLSSIRKISLFHTSQRARIEWVKECSLCAFNTGIVKGHLVEGAMILLAHRISKKPEIDCFEFVQYSQISDSKFRL